MVRHRLRALLSSLAVATPGLMGGVGCTDDTQTSTDLPTTETDTTGTTDPDSEATTETDTTSEDTTMGPATDTSSSSMPTTVDPTTGGPNGEPVAKNDGKYISKSGYPLVVLPFEGLLANDADPDMDILTVVAVDPITANGAEIQWDMTGGFTYNAPANFWGTDSFSYTITDGNNAFDTATVTVAVNPVEIEGGDIDTGAGGFVIDGQFSEDHTGESVRHAGDVNGDGYDDIIVGARLADSNEIANSGRTYVVFGGPSAMNITLANLEDAKTGFVIAGAGVNDESGRSVSGAGDVNGDGKADLVIGVPNADANGTNSGRAYVVFGKSLHDPVDLGEVAAGVGGFMLEGQEDINFAGYAVSGAGDVNGDGLDDVLIGALGYDVGDESFAGRAYVVFGRKDTQPASLTHVAAGIGGFAISGVSQGDFTGSALSGAGDVNGDGLADVIIGAHGADGAGALTGRAYVVFGKSGNDNIDLAEVMGGTGGFVIEGEYEGDRAGFSVAGAGDLNGDGLDDVVLGAPRADPAGDASGRCYVVWGKEDGEGVLLSELHEGAGLPDNPGFVINGSFIRDYAGTSVDGAGDVNGDGLDDLIIGAYGSDPNGSQSGRAFIVYGKQDTSTANLAAVAFGTGGFVVNGEQVADHAGYSVSGGGDVDGDGFSDVLVCAEGSDAAGFDAGRCYVVFGGDFSNVVDGEGSDAPELLNGNPDDNILIAGGGTDTITGAGGWDVLYGGHGQDTIRVPDDQFRRIDGGGKQDDLLLDGTGMIFDLTVMPARKVFGIEYIDLGTGGGNTLIIDARSMRELTDERTFIRVKGDATGTVQADLTGEGFMDDGLIEGYQTFSNGRMTLQIETAVTAQVDL